MDVSVKALLDRESVRFVVTGVGAAGLLAVLTFAALHSPLSPFTGTLLAYAVTVVASYLTQQGWTFRGQHRHSDAFPRYCLAQVACATSAALVAQGLARHGVAALFVSALVTGTASVASYALSRFWVFPAGRNARR